MKNIRVLTAVSLVALLAAAPALAENMTTYDEGGKTVSKTYDATPKGTSASDEIKQGWESAKDNVSNAVSNAGDKVEKTADNVKASMMNDDPKIKAAPVTLDKRMTANGMIGKPVYNQQNEKVAVVEDVILDSSGAAKLVVVKDGDFMGLGGKLAAFDYDAVIDRTKEGDVVMPITEKTIDKVAEFSYEPSEKNDIRVIPANGYSVKKILDGNLVDQNGKKLAAIDNVSLRDGRAQLVIAAYDQTLGMGGDKVALNFDATRLVRDQDNVDLKLNAAQSAEFKTFEKTTTK